MSAEGASTSQREFHCGFCQGKILIPRNLPPTTAPCPHCGATITSPELEDDLVPASLQHPEISVPVRTEPELPAPAAVPVQPEPEVQAPAMVVEPEPVRVPVEASPVAEPASIPVPAAYSPLPEPPVKSVAPEDEPPPLPPRRMRSAGILEETPAVPQSRQRSSLLVPILIMLLLLALVGVVLVLVNKFYKNDLNKVKPEDQARIQEEKYYETGWQEDATGLLDRFASATTVEEKVKCVLHPEQQLADMKKFYATRKVDDSDSPANAFAVYDLPDSDKKRGMFMMMYDQPPQLRLRDSFYPISTLELQNGLEDPDLLLSSAANASNFASEPIKIQAIFLRTDQGLKLDWPTYVQTKYRLFRQFTSLPTGGDSGVFRVLIQEDVPEKGRVIQGSRAYKIYDPGNVSDYVRVNVPVDSDTGHALAEINWIGTRNTRMDWRTATVELQWSTEEIPQLQMKRFICWEFLGLGGADAAAGK